MKLLYLAPIRFPSERAHAAQIANMCNAFVENGAEVTLVVPKRKNPVKEDAFTYFHIPESFNIKYLFCTPWNVGSKFGFFSNLLVYILRATWYTLSHKPDIIYSRSEWVIAFLAFFLNKNKLVWESHDGTYNFASKKIFSKKIRIITTSLGQEQFFIQKGMSKESVITVPNGINDSFFKEVESKFDSRKRLGLPQDRKIVLYIGGFDAWKGVETFFKSAKLLPSVLFVVIGGQEEELQKYIIQYPEVTFLGPRPYQELKHNQQLADVLVIPNTAKNIMSEKFTSPLKLFAHMASGVPIVASNLPSIKNIVGESYITTFAPDDAESLAQSISLSLAHNDVSIQQAQSLKKFAEGYTWKNRASLILSKVISLNIS